MSITVYDVICPECATNIVKYNKESLVHCFVIFDKDFSFSSICCTSCIGKTESSYENRICLCKLKTGCLRNYFKNRDISLWGKKVDPGIEEEIVNTYCGLLAMVIENEKMTS